MTCHWNLGASNSAGTIDWSLGSGCSRFSVTQKWIVVGSLNSNLNREGIVNQNEAAESYCSIS